MKKRIYILIGYFFIVLTVFVAGFYIWLSNKYVVPIIMYHRVAYNELPDSVVMKPEKLRYHMEYLKRNGYNVISFAELVNAIKNKKKVPLESSVYFDFCLTF